MPGCPYRQPTFPVTLGAMMRHAGDGAPDERANDKALSPTGGPAAMRFPLIVPALLFQLGLASVDAIAAGAPG